MRVQIVRVAVAAVASGLYLSSCASPGPVIPSPPEVELSQLESLLFTPEVVKFQAKVVIRNTMGATLRVDKVDWGADLHDRPVFSETFSEVRPISSRGENTLTFPFQIAMKDIAHQAVDVLAEEALRVTFRGQVFPMGFDPVPFEGVRAIPLPRPPSFAFERADGSPFEKVLTVYLQVKNPNAFPLSFSSIETYLELNGKRYGLLQSRGCSAVGPGATEQLVLSMEQSTGKTLSMGLNLATGGKPQLAIGGALSCRTPYGLVQVPVQVSFQ